MGRLEALLERRILGSAKVATEGSDHGPAPRAGRPLPLERDLRNLLQESVAQPLCCHDLEHFGTEKPFTKNSLALNAVLAPFQEKLDKTFLSACLPTDEEIRLSGIGCADVSLSAGADMDGSMGASPSDGRNDDGGTGGVEGGAIRKGSTGGATEDSSARHSEDCMEAEWEQAAA